MIEITGIFSNSWGEVGGLPGLLRGYGQRFGVVFGTADRRVEVEGIGGGGGVEERRGGGDERDSV